MTNLTKIALLALATVIAGTAIASAAPVLILKRTPHSSPNVVCRLHGTDLFVMNFGEKNLDSGRQLEWASRTTGDQGTLMLPVMLAPGEEVRIADVLSIESIRGAQCEIAIAA